MIICHPGLLFGRPSPAVASYKERLRASDWADPKANAPQFCFVHFDSLKYHKTSSICGVLEEYVNLMCLAGSSIARHLHAMCAFSGGCDRYLKWEYLQRFQEPSYTLEDPRRVAPPVRA